jgi:hypothetical protein
MVVELFGPLGFCRLCGLLRLPGRKRLSLVVLAAAIALQPARPARKNDPSQLSDDMWDVQRVPHRFDRVACFESRSELWCPLFYLWPSSCRMQKRVAARRTDTAAA